MKPYTYLIVSLVLTASCDKNPAPEFLRSDFGRVDGKKAALFTVKFPGKLEAKVTNYGRIITSLLIPDKEGKPEDVVLGYDQLQGYLDDSPYFGALIGRYGNRIAKGKFSLQGKTYALAANNNANHLHGGVKGFDKVVWDIAETKLGKDEARIVLKYTSKDGEGGYPGNLHVTVTYTFSENGFLINYEAATDKKTVVNLTQHSYFNLSGNAKEDILGHELQLNADRFLPVDSTLIPTGELRKVKGTPFDFTRAKRIGKDIEVENQQLAYGLGYDHCWVLNGGMSQKRRMVANLYHRESGRFMEVFTVEPAVQFYSGNFLDGSITGKAGKVYQHRYGLCLETQHYPDSPNQPHFPTVILNPGERYQTSTEYRFLVVSNQPQRSTGLPGRMPFPRNPLDWHSQYLVIQYSLITPLA